MPTSHFRLYSIFGGPVIGNDACPRHGSYLLVYKSFSRFNRERREDALRQRFAQLENDSLLRCPLGELQSQKMVLGFDSTRGANQGDPDRPSDACGGRIPILHVYDRGIGDRIVALFPFEAQFAVANREDPNLCLGYLRDRTAVISSLLRANGVGLKGGEYQSSTQGAAPDNCRHDDR